MTFYVNSFSHEVHKSTCEYANPAKYPNIKYLGEYDYPFQAVAAAKEKGFLNADGCAYCCPGSHTK